MTYLLTSWHLINSLAPWILWSIVLHVHFSNIFEWIMTVTTVIVVKRAGLTNSYCCLQSWLGASWQSESMLYKILQRHMTRNLIVKYSLLSHGKWKEKLLNIRSHKTCDSWSHDRSLHETYTIISGIGDTHWLQILSWYEKNYHYIHTTFHQQHCA